MSKTKKKKGHRRTTIVPVEELARTVADDLSFLRRQSYSEIGRTEARIYSAILRRLLYDGTLQGAWSALGFPAEPTIKAIDLRAMVKEVPPEYIHFAYAGGADLPQARHTGQVLLVVPKVDHEALGGPALASSAIGAKIHPGEERGFTLSEFCASPSVIAGAAEVSRVEVVRYVANKLGGVHLDGARAEHSDFLGSRYRFLDENHLFVGRFPAALYEVLSIAQDVARTEDSGRLVSEADRQFPEPLRDPNVIAIREGRLGRFADFRFEKRDKDVNP